MADLFLRFGGVPAGGRSECHTLTQGQGGFAAWAEMDDEGRSEFEAAGYSEVDGVVYEPGVSAVGLEWGQDGDEGELAFDLAGCLGCDLESYSDRPAFLVAGDPMSQRGFCGEPLLRDAEVVGAVEVVAVGSSSIRVRRV